MQPEELNLLLDIQGEWFKDAAKFFHTPIKYHRSINGYAGMYVKVSDNKNTGVRYFLQLSEDVAANYAKIKYSDSYFWRFNAINPQNDIFVLNFVVDGHISSVANKEGIKQQLKDSIKSCIFLSDFSLYSVGYGKEYSNVHIVRIFIRKKYAMQMARQIFSEEVTQKMFSPEYNTIYRRMEMDFLSRGIIDKLSELDPDDINFGIHLSGAAQSLMAHFIDLTKNEKPIMLPLYKSDIEMVYDAQQYLIDHLEEEFPGIEKLSTISNMSGTKFKQLFAKIFGTSPNSFFISKKMDYAKEMLLSGRYKVTEVAYELAYSNLGFFTKQFKKKFGQLPKDIIPSS